MKNDQREKRKKIIIWRETEAKHVANALVQIILENYCYFICKVFNFILCRFALFLSFYCSYCRRPSVKLMAHFSNLQAPFQIFFSSQVIDQPAHLFYFTFVAHAATLLSSLQKRYFTFPFYLFCLSQMPPARRAQFPANASFQPFFRPRNFFRPNEQLP